MALRNPRPITWKPVGLSDAIDGSNAFPGAMSSLANLVPAPHTRGVFVPRPAAQQLNSFNTFTAPAQGEALFCVGGRYYGMIASGQFAGKSEPFCYDSDAGAFVPIAGVTANNTPASISTSGDWTPPTMAQIGSRVLVTHPGFSGGNFFGWLDMTSFTDGAKTGNTHTSTLIDTLSANVLLAGWRPGMTISDSAGDIPAGARIVSIAANGLSAVISAAATGSNAATTFTVAGGTFNSPLWCAGNVNQNPLIAKPVSVAQFSGRAWFAVNNAVAFSDSGDPIQATTATQVLTFQNGVNVTALAGLPLNNQLGGIIQSLMCFQGGAALQQITGDASTGNLAVNTLNEAVGTLAPNSIAPSPIGLLFIAPDGLRVIDFTARVSEPFGANGDGVALPFINANTPSRICGAYNEDVYRVSVTTNPIVGGQVQPTVTSVEYWYHLKLKSWTGPHTFPFRLITAAQTSLSFVGFALTAGALGLWQAPSLPTLGAGYIENGNPLSWTYATILLPDNETLMMRTIVEASLMLNPGGPNVTVIAIDDQGNPLDTVTIPGGGAVAGSLYDVSFWDQGQWDEEGGALTVYRQRALLWHAPIISRQFILQVNSTSGFNQAIGNLSLRYQELAYQLMFA